MGNTVIARCIGKSQEIMPPNKMLGSFCHDSCIEVVRAVVGIVAQKWVHHGIVIDPVTIELAGDRESSMEFRECGGNLSDSDVYRKKAIESCMNTVQGVIVERCQEVCNLKVSKAQRKMGICMSDQTAVCLLNELKVT